MHAFRCWDCSRKTAGIPARVLGEATVKNMNNIGNPCKGLAIATSKPWCIWSFAVPKLLPIDPILSEGKLLHVENEGVGREKERNWFFRAEKLATYQNCYPCCFCIFIRPSSVVNFTWLELQNRIRGVLKVYGELNEGFVCWIWLPPTPMWLVAKRVGAMGNLCGFPTRCFRAPKLPHSVKRVEDSWKLRFLPSVTSTCFQTGLGKGWRFPRTPRRLMVCVFYVGEGLLLFACSTPGSAAPVF